MRGLAGWVCNSSPSDEGAWRDFWDTEPAGAGQFQSVFRRTRGKAGCRVWVALLASGQFGLSAGTVHVCVRVCVRVDTRMYAVWANLLTVQ